ncbi:unnamed protein product [Amaranthus hypochondriacus]
MGDHILQVSASILLLFMSLPMIVRATDKSVVLDSSGNPIEVGSSYYIRTAVSQVGIGGGVVVASKPEQPVCPKYVGHLSAGFYKESPVMFYPSELSQKHIHVSSDVYIVFNATSRACPLGAWQVTPDANSDKVFISTGGVVGTPTTDNLFKIENDPIQGTYQLEYCPTKNNIMCGVLMTIDFTDDYELGWLGLSPGRDSYFAAISFIKA